VRITKVYTKTGDSGMTSLANGERVSKASLRVAAYGDVDELNSLLGLARNQLAGHPPGGHSKPFGSHGKPGKVAQGKLREESASSLQSLQQLLNDIQNHLFVLGADLSTPQPVGTDRRKDLVRRIAAADVAALEEAIDHYNDSLPPLQEFILPGGSEAGALLHVARAVARRAERTAVSLSETEQLNPHALIYLNRLSDLLFVLARVANRRSGSPEISAEFH